MKTNEERLNALEEKEAQREKDYKEIMIVLACSIGFLVLLIALVFSVQSYQNTKEILEILQK